MAVSKRLRFEILRRDGNSCRYCGGVAPDVTLQIDHVVPVALGGTDDPSNLVAACKDCNVGKSSIPAGAELVRDVADDAVRWGVAMRAAYDEALAALEVRDAYVDQFDAEWNRWGSGFNLKNKVARPGDWEGSVVKWYGLGIPIEILRDAIGYAMRKKTFHKSTDYPEFSYMAGTVWGMHTELQRTVAATMAVPEPVAGAPVAHCTNPNWCSAHDPEAPEACPQCGREGCDWNCGYQSGDFDGWERFRSMYTFEVYQSNVLQQVCDLGGYEAGVPF